MGRVSQHSVHLRILAQLDLNQLHRGLLVFSLVVCLFRLVCDCPPGKGKIAMRWIALQGEGRKAATYLRYEDVAGELRPQMWAVQCKLMYFDSPFSQGSVKASGEKMLSWELLSKQML